MKITKYLFERHGDERGQLVALEELKEIPFKIKRVYYIYDTLAGVVRGRHAHQNLQQILICIHGSCKVMLDDGSEKETVLLDRPEEGLYISNTVWRELYDFSPDAILLVLASNYYNESEYIRDYDEFLKFVHSSRKNESIEGHLA